MIYQIRDWRSHFENNKSREREQCAFVCEPNLIRVLAEPDGAAIIGVWVLILQACSRQGRHRDGWLTDDGHPAGNPWTIADLALRWRRPEAEIERTLFFLSSPQVGWIQTHAEVPAGCPSGALEEKRKELKRTEDAPNGDAGASGEPAAGRDASPERMNASEMLRVIWQEGVRLLRKQGGVTERDARNTLGKYANDYGKEALAAAILVTMKADSPDPIVYLSAVLKKGRKSGKDARPGETRQQRNLSKLDQRIAAQKRQANR